MSQKALIVGAGIAGLSLARRLLHLGIRPTLLDRRSRGMSPVSHAFVHRVPSGTLHAILGDTAIGIGSLASPRVISGLLTESLAARGVQPRYGVRIETVDWACRTLTVDGAELGFDILFDATGTSRAGLRGLPDTCDAVVEAASQASTTLAFNAEPIDGASLRSGVYRCRDIGVACLEHAGGARLTAGVRGRDMPASDALCRLSGRAFGANLKPAPVDAHKVYAFRELTRLIVTAPDDLPYIAIGDALMQTDPIHGMGLHALAAQLEAAEHHIGGSPGGPVSWQAARDGMMTAILPIWQGQILAGTLAAG